MQGVLKQIKRDGPVLCTVDPSVKIDHVEIGGINFWRATLEKGACLLWCAWRDEWQQPVFPSNTPYHPVVIRGKAINQPRRTVCYDHAYPYSGQVHPIEKDTPDAITQLYGIIESTFGERPNMCLANCYNHGEHYIGDHSDDEREMGPGMRNVYCFSVGASRILNIKRNGAIVISLMLPEGLYVMQGETFQKNYTHGFPKKSFSFKHPDTADMTTMQRADWAVANPELVKAALAGKKTRLAAFDKWRAQRISYTLRIFQTT